MSEDEFDNVINKIAEANSVEVEVDDETPMDKLEEVRRCLGSFLKQEVLQAMLDLYKILDKGPEQYVWFSRNSLEGRDCKYAVGVIEQFKKTRLDKVKVLLQECLDKVKTFS